MNCNHSISNDCISKIMTDIVEKQNKWKKEKFDQPINYPFYNTIPVLFTCNNGEHYFIGSGIYNDLNTLNYFCFETPVFRILSVNEESKSAVVELLQAQTSSSLVPPINNEKGICKFFSSGLIHKIIRTGIYITININVFSTIECLNPLYSACETPKGYIENPLIVKTEITYYITISDGIKREYNNEDGMEGYNRIPSPKSISYSNLFVNGVIQPNTFYQMEEGKLTLNTEDVPSEGTNIILQLIKIINDIKTF